MRSRDRLKKAAVTGSSQLHFSPYRHVRNKVNKLSNELKRQYFSEKITLHQDNTKESWKIINQVLKNWSISTNINGLSTPDGVIGNKQKIAYAMNKCFCSVGVDLAEKLEYAPNALLSGGYNVNPEEKCFRFNTTDVRNTRDAIGGISPAISSN